MITSIECCHVHSSESFHSFHRMFYNMPQIIFPEIFYDIPRNVWRHSPEYLATFPGMFGDIPQNVWRHSPEGLAIFPRMFRDIPLNIAFPLFPAFPAFRSPFLYSWFYTQPKTLSKKLYITRNCTQENLK